MFSVDQVVVKMETLYIVCDHHRKIAAKTA